MGTSLPSNSRPSRSVILSFVYIGIVQLIGLNVILTGASFLNQEVWVGKHWAFWSAIGYSAAVTLGNTLMIRGPLPRISFAVRWYTSLLSSIASIAGIEVMAFLTGQGIVGADLGFTLGLLCCVTQGLSSAIFQQSTFGLAGAGHPQLSAGLMTGGGFSGLITGAASTLPPSQRTLAGIAAAGVLIMLLAILQFPLMLQEDPYVKPILERLALDRLCQPSDSTQSIPSMPDLATRSMDMASNPFMAASPRRQDRLIAKDVCSQAAAVFFVLMTTFMVFPGIVCKWKGAFGLSDTAFSTLMVGAFQVFDVIGRTLASCVRSPNGKAVVLLSGSRVVFVPLFVHAEKLGDDFLVSGPWKALLMAMFASSNGFVSTLAMMLGPERVLFKEEKESAGTMMNLSLCTGIMVGSLLALLIQLV